MNEACVALLQIPFQWLIISTADFSIKMYTLLSIADNVFVFLFNLFLFHISMLIFI